MDLRNALSVLTAKVPVEWKCNFQNEVTQSEILMKIQIQFSLKTTSWYETHDSSSFAISFTHGTQINFGPLNDHMIMEISLVTMVTGHT